MSVDFFLSSFLKQGDGFSLGLIDWFAQQSLSIWDFKSILFCARIYDLADSMSWKISGYSLHIVS